MLLALAQSSHVVYQRSATHVCK